ncbi:hypothetical protein LS78_008700 [Helicobacter bilis]|nr:hypothetical protein LS78_008700 [Helicobacter bilis]
MKEYYKSLSDFFKSLMLFFATISAGLIAYIYTGNDYNMLPIFATFIFFVSCCNICFYCLRLCK